MNNKNNIIDIISNNKCPISAKNIWSKLENIDKTTIYRNIEKLLNDWIILEDFSTSWEKLHSIKKKHHHHFVCGSCNKTENIWCFMNNEINLLEEKFWFKVKNHSFVLNWICKKCG